MEISNRVKEGEVLFWFHLKKYQQFNMTNGIMKCNWNMNGSDIDIYRHLATAYTKENWFCDPFCRGHFGDWVTKICITAHTEGPAWFVMRNMSHINNDNIMMTEI